MHQACRHGDVKVELDSITLLDDRSAIHRVLVKAAKADVKIVVIPQIQELGSAIGEVGVADMDRSDESPTHSSSLPSILIGFVALGIRPTIGIS